MTAEGSGVWVHYALTRDAEGTLRIYINGTLDATGGAAFTAPFQVGFLGRTAAGVSRAEFDDIRIWSVARSADEIATTRSTYIDPTTPGLERLYSFEGSSTEVLDATGHSAAAPLGTGVTIVASDAPTTTALAPAHPLGPDAEVTAYVYDISTEDPLAHDDIVLEYTDSLLTRRWLHSNSVDEPVGFEEYVNTSGVGSGTVRTMFADRQGSVIWVADPATGLVVAAYKYDGYGQISQTVGTLAQPYGYTGREYDPESGLYHYRARAYDPAAGMFVQSDPIGFLAGSLSIFQYVGSDPLNVTDPLGLVSTREFVSRSPSDQANTTSAFTTVGVEAIGLAGDINAALSWDLPFAIELTEEWRPVSAVPGVCEQTVHDDLQAEVDRWRTRGCVEIPPNVFNTSVGDAMRMQNLRKLRRFSRLAIARATLAAVCYPGYYGPGDHRNAVESAIKGMRKCQVLINAPAGKGKK